MTDSRSVLIIDGDPSFRTNAGRFLVERGFAVSEAATAQSGLEAARRGKPTFVLVDLGLQQPRGADLVDALMALPDKPKVVCVGSNARVADVVAAVKAGALDVLERPVDGEKLVRLFERAARSAATPSLVAVPTTKPIRLTREPVLDALQSKSELVKNVVARVGRLAETETAIVLEGEPGSGQEALARHFHRAGPRSEGPFVMVPAHPVDGATPEEALFGSTSTISAFAQAKGGVVFIESMLGHGPSGQERLAKLLQGLAAAKVSGSAVRWPPMVIGVERPVAVEIDAGRVRRDLGQFLGRATVQVPSLRSRREDLPEMIARVVAAIQAEVGAAEAHVAPEVMEELLGRDWESGIPELIGAISRAAAFDDLGRVVLDLTPRFEPSPVVDADSFKEEPEELVAQPEEDFVPQPVLWAPTLDERGRVQPYDVYEAQIFRFALKNAGGCVSRAAELLGVGRATMYRKMRAYEIDVPPVSERSIARSRRVQKRPLDAGALGTSDLVS